LKELIVSELLLAADALKQVAEQVSEDQVQKAFALLSACTGKIVLTGIGKAGIIARKISATLASTGTTSIFLHAAEGIHGDLGMLNGEDVVIAVSNSGNTQELLSIIPFIKFLHIPLIAITGNVNSQLAQHADCVLDCTVPKDYEPFGLVPTVSTTVALAMGDALAVALLRHKNFREEDFARFHPGGAIGKKLLLRVADLMHQGTELPIVYDDTEMAAVILEISSKKLGCTTVIDHNGLLVGMITDGDLRRQLQSKNRSLFDYHAAACMTENPKHTNPNELAVNALNIMEEKKITMLPVVNEDGKPVGMLHMHDLIQAGVV